VLVHCYKIDWYFGLKIFFFQTAHHLSALQTQHYRGYICPKWGGKMGILLCLVINHVDYNIRTNYSSHSVRLSGPLVLYKICYRSFTCINFH